MAEKKQRGREERQSTARRRAETHQGGFSRTTFRVPDGMNVWQPKAGETYTIDILPYKVGKRKFAQGITFADAGFEHFERTFFNHARIGPNEDAYVCSAKTFDKPCPVCEYRGKISKEGASQDEIKALYSKERQLFVVYDHADKAKGPQLWEVSYHLFGKLLDTRIKSAKNGRYDGFYFPDKEGRTLEVTFIEKSMGQNKFSEVVSIDFTERDEAVPEEVMEKVPCLDDLIIEMPHDKLKQIFLQEPEAEGGDKSENIDEDDDKPVKKSKPKDDDDSDDDDKPAAKKKSTVKDDDDLVDDEDGDLDDDDKPKGKKSAKDDDDLDDDDDPKPVKKSKPKDDDDDKPKSKKSTTMPNANELGLKEGMTVTFEGEKCKIIRVSGDGTSLTLKESDGTVHKAIGPDRVKVPKAKAAEPDDDGDGDGDDDPKPAKKKAPKDEDDDFDDD